jgi:Dihydroxyacetone kinase
LQRGDQRRRAVEKSTYTTGRRGVAGTLIVEKMVGAAAENRNAACASRRSAMKSTGARARWAWRCCRAPCRRRAAELHAGRRRNGNGVGIHGEPAGAGSRLAPADAIAEELVGAILKDLAPKPGSEVLLLVNGFGATPLIELYLMVNSARRILDGAGSKRRVS